MATILTVEDEAGIRDFVVEVLVAEGHEVVSAADGDEALARLADRPFDLLLADLRMPGSVDGLEVVRRARAANPGMQVVVMTAYGSVATAVEAMRLGAFDFLEKPVAGPAALAACVQRALAWRGVGQPGALPSSAPEPEPTASRVERVLFGLSSLPAYRAVASYLAVWLVMLESAQLLEAVMNIPGWALSAMGAFGFAGLPAALLFGALWRGAAVAGRFGR